MTKWIVFGIYWISLVLTMRQGALWTWWFLIPSFLILYMWAEDCDESIGPAASHARNDQ